MEEMLKQILAELVSIRERLDALEGKQPEPSTPTTVDFWTRPTGPYPAKYVGHQMTEANGEEVMDRARYGINWRGDTQLAGQALERAWTEIEKLKVSQPQDPFVDRYRLLWPDMAYVMLLTGMIDPSGVPDFGAGKYVINGMAGKTPQDYITEQLNIVSGGGSASGDE